MHKKLLEAALFMAPEPLNISELAKIVGISSLGHVKKLLVDLQKEYSDNGIEITEGKAGWQMQVKPELLPRVAHLSPYSDLSDGCKRTLALVAYKEPVKQAEIIKIQGNKAYTYIKFLEKRGLIKTEKKGHTKTLKLTKEFERYFGEEKESVKERISSEFNKQEE